MWQWDRCYTRHGDKATRRQGEKMPDYAHWQYKLFDAGRWVADNWGMGCVAWGLLRGRMGIEIGKTFNRNGPVSTACIQRPTPHASRLLLWFYLVLWLVGCRTETGGTAAAVLPSPIATALLPSLSLIHI